MSQQQTPPVDPKAIKPGRFWYWIAGIIAVAGIGAGVTVFVLGISSVAGALPEMDETFEPGESARVELSRDREYAIYVDYAGETAPDAQCSATGPGTASVDEPTNTSFTAGDGRRTWHLLYDLTVSKDGEYTVECVATNAGDFAVGDAVDVGGFVGGIFGSIGGLLGIPCFSIVVGGVIVLVVALRRSANKKALPREGGPRSAPRHPDAPGAW